MIIDKKNILLASIDESVIGSVLIDNRLYFSNTLIVCNNIVSNDTIVIYLTSRNTNCIVSWGDGSTTTDIDPGQSDQRIEHTYQQSFNKVVITISGDCNFYVVPPSSTILNKISKVYFRSDIDKIERACLWGVSSLEEVYIPNSVTSIENYAFYDCDSLTSVVIPDNVISIGEEAFCSCNSLTSVTIGDSVTSIGESAFYGCPLTTINVSNNNTTYKSIDGNLYSKDGKTLIQYAIGKTATEFSIPDSVTSIGDEAFEGCTSLTSITIPEVVTSIGKLAFYNCSSLTSATFMNTNNWKVYDTPTSITGTSVNVTNVSTAATYLKTTYVNKYWRCSFFAFDMTYVSGPSISDNTHVLTLKAPNGESTSLNYSDKRTAIIYPGNMTSQDGQIMTDESGWRIWRNISDFSIGDTLSYYDGGQPQQSRYTITIINK